MYIIKNAIRCISRAKGRNVLIGIIVFVIAVSACIGLSIRQAAESARKETMDSISITGTISFDRSSMMQNMAPPSDFDPSSGGGFNREDFADKMGEMESLTLEDYQKYATASTVEDYYYTMSVSMNGNDDFLPVSNESSSSSSESDSSSKKSNGFGGFPGFMGGGGMQQMMGMDSDFTIEGVSSEKAMTSFMTGTATISDGTVFEEGGEAYDCIITEELATYNNVVVGDSIVLTNPNNEEETVTLNVVGLYTDSTANESSFSIMGSTATDPVNKIYISYNALAKIGDESANNATTETDDETGREFSTELRTTVNFTYCFADTDAYYQFEEEVRDLGLDDSYSVSSNDISSFENSLVPLQTLSTTAGYFLIVILIIGIVILVVLNIFNVRERKYEIGVLTAMGMHKSKVALQFITEIFAVTLAAVILGIGIGAVGSVPVTNALLQNQITSQENSSMQIDANFGRGDFDPSSMGQPPSMPGGSGGGFGGFSGDFKDLFATRGDNNYITEINNAMNFTVVLQMFGIAMLLTIAAGAVSMLFVMRYEPLKILANRD